MTSSRIGPATGVGENVRALQALRLSALADEVTALLKKIGADAGDYDKAPEAPGQRYVRSGDLGKGWQGEPVLDVSGETLLGVITNGVPYAAHVQGADDQRETFAGRWRTDQQIADEWAPEVERRIAKAVEDLYGVLS